MKSVKDFVDNIFKLDEGDGADPLTLVNLILHKDLRHGGYNWGSPFPQKTPQAVLNVAGTIPPPDYIREASEKEQPQQTDPQQVQQSMGQQGQVPVQQIKTQDGQIIELERNKIDPNVCSSLPAFNNCPAFFMKDMQSAPICRVTNRVCIYLNSDYKQCGIYNTAANMDPNNWELPLGKEQTYAYLMGLKQ